MTDREMDHYFREKLTREASLIDAQFEECAAAERARRFAQVNFEFPHRASEFFALLEQRDRLRYWTVDTDSPVRVTFKSRFWSGRGRPRLVFSASAAPEVELGQISFPLHQLATPNAVWNPNVYPSNPFMPMEAKRFLDELVWVISGVAFLPCASDGTRRLTLEEYGGEGSHFVPRLSAP